MSARNWRNKAACRGASPALFVSTERPGTAEYEADVKMAKAVCANCPVRLVCLAASMEGPDGVEFGVWGGKSYEERIKK